MNFPAQKYQFLALAESPEEQDLIGRWRERGDRAEAAEEGTTGRQA